MRIFVLLTLFALLMSCDSADKRPLTLGSVISDHMVLQQQENVKLWGEYSPGQTVNITTSWGAESKAKTGTEGKWTVEIATPAAGGPYEIDIVTKDSTITINDVLIGEVWLASGQSNMQMTMTGYLPNEPIDNSAEEIDNANYNDIRMFTVVLELSDSKKKTLKGEWKICNPNNAPNFSATGYFFARKVHQELNVPVGIIHTSWGGTEAEAWTSKEGLSAFPEFVEEIESFDALGIADWGKQFPSIPQPMNLAEFEQLDLNDSEIIQSDFDDSAWPRIDLPHDGCLSDHFIPGISFSANLNGVFWYRKTFELDKIDSDFTLTIGAIDDADVTFVNGQKVGATLNWNEERRYVIPSSLLRLGENTIAIKQYDSGGGSAIRGPIELKNQYGKTVKLEGSWSGLFYGDLKRPDIILYGTEHQHELKDRPKAINVGPNELASSLYNAMIHPITPYAIKGAIWYQGESNVGRAEQYARLFPAMIEDWRAQWNADFPFYFVQIAPFSYGNELSPALRDAQRLSLKTAKTGMAIAMDIGHPTSIHPGNKQDVGHRLALLALANDYNQEVVASGPLYKEHSVSGNTITVEFDHAGSGLIFKKDDQSGFEIAGQDGQFFPAQTTVLNDRIEVSSATVDHPVHVRYGWKDYFDATLFNKEGLPASSFTTVE